MKLLNVKFECGINSAAFNEFSYNLTGSIDFDFDFEVPSNVGKTKAISEGEFNSLSRLAFFNNDSEIGDLNFVNSAYESIVNIFCEIALEFFLDIVGVSNDSTVYELAVYLGTPHFVEAFTLSTEVEAISKNGSESVVSSILSSGIAPCEIDSLNGSLYNLAVLRHGVSNESTVDFGLVFVEGVVFNLNIVSERNLYIGCSNILLSVVVYVNVYNTTSGLSVVDYVYAYVSSVSSNVISPAEAIDLGNITLGVELKFVNLEVAYEIFVLAGETKHAGNEVLGNSSLILDGVVGSYSCALEEVIRIIETVCIVLGCFVVMVCNLCLGPEAVFARPCSSLIVNDGVVDGGVDFVLVEVEVGSCSVVVGLTSEEVERFYVVGGSAVYIVFSVVTVEVNSLVEVVTENNEASLGGIGVEAFYIDYIAEDVEVGISNEEVTSDGPVGIRNLTLEGVDGHEFFISTAEDDVLLRISESLGFSLAARGDAVVVLNCNGYVLNEIVAVNRNDVAFVSITDSGYVVNIVVLFGGVNRGDLVYITLYEFCFELCFVVEEAGAGLPTVVCADSEGVILEVVGGVTSNNDVTVRVYAVVIFNYDVVSGGCALGVDLNDLAVNENVFNELVEERIEEFRNVLLSVVASLGEVSTVELVVVEAELFVADYDVLAGSVETANDAGSNVGVFVSVLAVCSDFLNDFDGVSSVVYIVDNPAGVTSSNFSDGVASLPALK